MSRRHERARRSRDDEHDPDARVIDHGRYRCVVIEAPGASWRDVLRALAIGDEAMREREAAPFDES